MLFGFLHHVWNFVISDFHGYYFSFYRCSVMLPNIDIVNCIFVYFTDRRQRNPKQFRYFIIWLHYITGKLYVSVILESKVRLPFLETTSDVVWPSQVKVITRFVWPIGIFRGLRFPLSPNTTCLLQRTHHRGFPYQHCGLSIAERGACLGTFLLILTAGGRTACLICSGWHSLQKD